MMTQSSLLCSPVIVDIINKLLCLTAKYMSYIVLFELLKVMFQMSSQ
jgi:hypothetical protein